jgi:hypothetical protein
MKQTSSQILYLSSKGRSGKHVNSDLLPDWASLADIFERDDVSQMGLLFIAMMRNLCM